jgi:futalosine hydrolase
LQGNTYDLAINAGIAGSFKSKFKMGQVLDVKEDCFADLGIQDQNHFETLFEAGFLEKDTFPFEDGKLKKTYFHENMALDRLAKVSGITANTTHGAAQAIETLRQKFNPDVESMEGAGFFFVCRMMNVPAIQVRAVSNHVGPREVEKWDIPMATGNLARALVDIIKGCG